MTPGAPHVDLAALIGLNQVLTDAERNRRSPDDSTIVQEERNEDDHNASPDPGAAAIEPVVHLTGISLLDRSKARILLAQILMQAAGLSVEELDDDKH